MLGITKRQPAAFPERFIVPQQSVRLLSVVIARPEEIGPLEIDGIYAIGVDKDLDVHQPGAAWRD